MLTNTAKKSSGGRAVRRVISVFLAPLKFVNRILLAIDKGFYTLRRLLWNYPDVLAGKEGSLLVKVKRVYSLTRPYSHFTVAVLVITIWGWFALASQQVQSYIFPYTELVEGIVMGTDKDGNLQHLAKVNPLLPSSIQLEKDISELVYEPLIRYEQDGSITPVLAEQIIRLKEGADYEFVLRNDVFWHDGKKFGVQDVISSLEIVSQLDNSKRNSFIQAVKQMAWEQTGPNSIRICTTSQELLASLEPGYENLKCSAVKGEKPILANFLELMGFKIMPAHLTKDINALNIDKPEPYINRFPVGTGPYKFAGSSDRTILLKKNTDYYGQQPTIDAIQMRLFEDEESAVKALEAGEIHSLISASTLYLREVEQYKQLTVNKSSTLETQYWAIYFSLKKNPDGKPIGPEFFQDVRVRRALSAAINRERILEALQHVGGEATGPISATSQYYNANAGWYRYNLNQAAQLLDEAGWNNWETIVISTSVNSEGRREEKVLTTEEETDLVQSGVETSIEHYRVRTKDGQHLVFHLAYTDNYDRNQIVGSIKQDLLTVGAYVIADAYNLQDLNTQVTTPKLFDTLLYGMSTFIDPDRYELFHSGTELNLASYVGEDQTVKIEGNQTVHVPRIDKLLEQGRSFDPDEAIEKRKETYNKVQEILAADAPVIFLYHPQFIYYMNRKVQGLDLSNIASMEQRFRNIASWKISID